VPLLSLAFGGPPSRFGDSLNSQQVWEPVAMVSAEAGAPETPGPSPNPRIDSEGHYFIGADLSYLVIGTYLFLLLLVVLILPTSSIVLYSWLPWLIAALVVFFLVRYLSTCYWIDADRLTAFRILGGRHLSLKEVRRIQFASLRDLSPTGFFGSWGYRGRMWSPVIGKFDSVYTASAGILIVAGDFPLFISPRHPQDFARELSRRVRSYRGPLEVDDGAPDAGLPAVE
jgi:hypothetical protein